MKRRLPVLLLPLLLTPAFADTDVATSQPAPPAEEPAPSLITLTGALDITNTFIYRGYLQHTNGVILQPALTFNFNLPQLQPDEGLSITPYIGNWNSTSTVSNSPKSPKWWFESDIFAGAALALNNWSLDLYYQYNAYPGAVWTDTQEIDATLAYDDSDFTQKLLNAPAALHPYLTLARELTHSDNILDGSPGTYLELGVIPTLTLPTLGNLALSLPTRIGMSLDDYYLNANGSNEPFGYFATAFKAELPLDTLLPCPCGEWKAATTLTYYRLNAASALDANFNNADALTIALTLQFTTR